MSSEDPFNIEALQRQLEELYQTDVKRNLNERLVVELVLQLIREGELDVYFSSDGKEYITPKQLDNELRQLIDRHGGRVQIIDLPPQLNVDFKCIEERIYDMIKRSRGKLSLTSEGEIISATYLELVAQEIDETVKQHGIISLENLSRRFALPLTMISSIVDEQLNTRITNCKLDNGILYQESVRARYKAIIRGTLRAATSPINVDTIIRRHELQADLALSCFEELLSEDKTIPGVVEKSRKGDRQQVFCPQIYINARTKWLMSFFQSNGYLTNDRIEKMGIRDRSSLNFGGRSPTFLESCIVSDSLIAMIDGEILAAVHSSQPIDAANVISFSQNLSKRDVSLLLKSCSGLEAALAGPSPSATLFEDTLIVPTSFLDSFMARYEQYASKNPKTIPPIAQDDLASRTRRNAALLDEASRLLREWHPSICSDAPSLCKCIAEHVRPDLDRIRQRLDRALFTASLSGSVSARDRGKAFQDKFDYILMNIQFFSLGLKDVSDATTRTSLDQYLCSTLGNDLINHLVERLAEENFVQVKESNAQGLTSDQREKVLKQLPSDIRDSISRIIAAKDSGSSGLLQEFHLQASTLELQIKENEEAKLRKSLLSHHKQLASQQLSKLLASTGSSAEDSGAIYRLSVSLLYMQDFEALIYASGKSINVMAERCKSRTDEHIKGLLDSAESDASKALELASAALAATKKKKSKSS